MARIRTYPNDTTLEPGDQLIGSDFMDGNTENYTLENLRTYIIEGLGAALPVEIPLGFAATIKRNGTEVERSLYRVLEVGNPIQLNNDRFTGTSVFLSSRNAATFAEQIPSENVLTVRDLNDGMFGIDFDLASFVGATLSATIGSTTYTGTITSFLPPRFETGTDADRFTHSTYSNVNGNIYTDWRFGVTLSPTFVSQSNQQVDVVTISAAQPIESQFIGGIHVTGNARISGDLTVEGTSFFQDIEVAGEARFTGNSGGILFGAPEPGVSYTHDGTDLTIAGPGVIRTTTRNTYTEGLLRINTGDDPLSGGEDVRIVRGDAQATTLRGLLTSIRIGDEYWNIPTGDSGILQFFPGVSFESEGPDAATTTNAFFYARENGNTFTGATAVAENPEGIALAANAITGTVVDTAGENTQRAIFQTMFENIPTGQALFFTTGTDEVIPPTPGTVPPVFEVINYDVSTGEFNFTLLGGGVLSIAPRQIRFPNVPNTPAPAGTVASVLAVDDQGIVYSGNQIGDVPTFNGLTFTDSTTGNTASINSITVQPPEAYTVSESGDIALNLSTGTLWNNANATAISFTAVPNNAYVLLAPLLPTNPTITLPPGTAGAFVRIHNRSKVMVADPDAPVRWRIIPNVGERISRLPVNEELVLDEAFESFTLYYTDAATGWIIA